MKAIKRHFGKFDTCVREAKQFLTVSEYCLSQNGVTSCKLIFPLFVNGALACELFFKAIMIAESDDSSFLEGHNLKSLFEGMSKEAQKAIIALYNKKSRYISLPMLLDKYQNNFIEWRYCFEAAAEGNQLGIIYLAESLKEYIEINEIKSKEETEI